jgi:endonuclease/exonuclease/phosphatase family metal-dependent hydrolase
MLRVVTYNIYWGKRLIDIISWIEQQTTPDIICLQEFPVRYLAIFYRSLPRVWGHRFTESFVYRKNTYGIVTLFRRKKLRVVKTKTLLMGIHPMEKSILRNPMEKSCLVTTFRVGTKMVTVANTHLVFLAANRSRYKQIQLIVDHLASCRHAAIITGDFNLHSVKANKKLISFMESFGFRTIAKRLSTYRLALWRYQLDYVFVKHCSLASLALDRIRLSDHYPVTAIIRLPN